MNLKEIRLDIGITQKVASEIAGVPLRTYKNYENDLNKKGSIKYNYIIEKLNEYVLIDENKGILSIDKIKKVITEVFNQYNVSYAYLFGSYAKNLATEISDIDLLISTDLTGIKYYELVEELRTKLKKRVDVLVVKQLIENTELINEILETGIKIYG